MDPTDNFIVFKAQASFRHLLDYTYKGASLSQIVNSVIRLNAGALVWGVVASGHAEIESNAGSFILNSDMVFCLPGVAKLRANGKVFLIENESPAGLLQIAGPVEKQGRLRYIDGCTDTLLISPLKLGEACLNHLHFPCGIKQTMHTHSSYRIGLVLRGKGVCHLRDRSLPLNAGSCFALKSGVEHAFHTNEHSMDIIAFHPDSDYGPQDQDHPMINRTLVNGVSANQLEDIQT